VTVSSKSHQGRNRKKERVKGMDSKLNVNYLRLITILFDICKLQGRKKFENYYKDLAG
jgi:hypothetical protein